MRSSNSASTLKARGRWTSRKSALTSAQRPDSLPRKRTLKRGCRYENLNDDHLKWLWAAYRRGVFASVPQFRIGLDPYEFRQVLFAAIGELLQQGGEAWVFFARTPRGEIPVGLINMAGRNGYGEPHVFWFPEASPRNKLECILRWLVDVKAKTKLVLWIRPEHWTFYDHLCKYGVLRTVGTYRGFFPDGENARLYQGVNEWRKPSAQSAT